jgi:hypothetical protein
MVSKILKFGNQKGNSLSLLAHGCDGARATSFLAAHFAKRNTKFGGGAERQNSAFGFSLKKVRISSYRRSQAIYFPEFCSSTADENLRFVLTDSPVRTPFSFVQGELLASTKTSANSVQLFIPNFPSINSCFFALDHPLSCLSLDTALCLLKYFSQ